MKHWKIKWSKISLFLFGLLFFMSINAYAAEGDEIEIDSNEQVDYVEGDTIDKVDKYVDGIYNTNEYMRTGISGVVRLAQSGTKLHGSYSTSYTHVVDKIGVKDVKLQYKGSLKIWYTIITLDDRHFTNNSTYMGSFTTTGTIGRTYRLKATHYVTENGSTQTKANMTGELTF